MAASIGVQTITRQGQVYVTMDAKGRTFLALSVCLVVLLVSGRADGQGVAGETFSIQGVAPHDVLNDREGPDPRSAKVETIPGDGPRIVPTGSGTQVGGSTWREIDYRGTPAWVNARFLELEQQGSDDGLFEEPLNCGGTEPFWSLKVDSRVRFKLMAEPYPTLSGSKATLSANHTNVWSLEAQGTGGERAVLFLRKTGQCSDDMSDFRYQYEVFVRIGGEVYSGCCNRLP